VITFLLPFYCQAQVTPADSGKGGKIIIVGPDGAVPVDTSASNGKILISPGDSTNGKILVDAAEEEKKKKEKVKKEKPEQDTTIAINGPRLAFRRSLVLPGWGQIYNKSAWKVPVIYAGFGAFTYFFLSNNKNYQFFKTFNLFKVTGDSTYYQDPNPFYYYGEDNIRDARDFYRRYRDLNVIFGALWYGLNLVDAFVEAHLDGFNISDDLSLRIGPALPQDPQFGTPSLGVGITLTFR
jgi:Family of unknown function (DUF5683)